MVDRAASPKEMAEEFGVERGHVSYHVRILRDLGLVVEESNRRRRGAVERFYRAIAPTVVPPGAWDDLPSSVRKGVSAQILRDFLDDAQKSMADELFDASPGELCWTPLVVDPKGLDEIGALSRTFIESVLRIQANADERLRAETEKAQSVTVFLASFLSARSPGDGKRASAMKRR